MQQQLLITQKQLQQKPVTQPISTLRQRSKSVDAIVSNRKSHGTIISNKKHEGVTSHNSVVEVIQYETIQKLLQAANTWKFNVFDFKRITAGSPLTYLGMSLFGKHDLIRHFKLDPVKLMYTFRKIEDGYLVKNSYHNALHAVDVMQAINCLLTEKKLKDTLIPLDVLCSLMAAVCHDLDHPGVNNVYLVRTNNYLAKLYKDSSVLENHHWRVAISLLEKTGLFDHFNPETWCYMKTRISDMIMATDISRQNDYLQKFQEMVDNLRKVGANEESIKYDEHNKKLILEIALKCADISNPCRSWDISYEWSGLVCEEFFNQGDDELRLGLPVSFNRNSSTIPGIQTYFINNLVKPLFGAWNNFMNTLQSQNMQAAIDSNLSIWEGKADVIKKKKEEEEKEAARQKENESSEKANGIKVGESESEQKQREVDEALTCVTTVSRVSSVNGLTTSAAMTTSAKILNGSQNNVTVDVTNRQLSAFDGECIVNQSDYDSSFSQHISRRGSLPITLTQTATHKSPAASPLASVDTLKLTSNSYNLTAQPHQRRISLPNGTLLNNTLSPTGAGRVDSQPISLPNSQSSDIEDNSLPESPSLANRAQAPFLAANHSSYSPLRRSSAPLLDSSNIYCTATSRRANRTSNIIGKPLIEGTPVNYGGFESSLIESSSSDNMMETNVTSVASQTRPRTVQYYRCIGPSFSDKPRSNSVDMTGIYGNLSTLNAHLRFLSTSMTINKSNNCATQMSSLVNLHSSHSSTSDIMAVM